MTYNAKISDQALLDLKMLHEYIANVLMEPRIVEKGAAHNA